MITAFGGTALCTALHLLVPTLLIALCLYIGWALIMR